MKSAALALAIIALALIALAKTGSTGNETLFSERFRIELEQWSQGRGRTRRGKQEMEGGPARSLRHKEHILVLGPTLQKISALGCPHGVTLLDTVVLCFCPIF